MKERVYNLSGINLKVQPMLHQPGDLIRSVNVETFPIGAKRKRPGYSTYLGTMPNGSAVQGLFSWQRNNGTQFWNYAFAGGLLYYSTQGTGAWTITGNGTWNAGGTVTNAVGWDNGTVGTTDVLFVADGVGTIRHSSSCTNFVDTSGAPGAAVALSEFDGRIYAAGTNSYLFWSNFATVTDWTNDSTSVLLPGPGKPSSAFKSANKLVIGKNSGAMFTWDGLNLNDLATKLGPTSQQSVGEVEDYRIYLNRLGFYGFGGAKPELLSNAIERQIYNDVGEGIIGTTFDNAPATVHLNRYYCTIGTVTDDLTDETISDAIAVYDFQLNDWWNYSFANRPTAWLSYKDASGVQQLIFGAGNQCHTLSGTSTSDNGSTIESITEGVIHLSSPESNKDWKYMWAQANPGCEGQLQIALSDTFTKAKKTWVTLGQFVDGVAEYRFPSGSSSKLLFWKFAEASRNARFSLYGFTIDADIIDRT